MTKLHRLESCKIGWIKMKKASAYPTTNAARKTALLDDDVYRQSEQIVDDVEGELDYENAYYSHDALLSMYGTMRDAIDAFATSKFLGADESVLGQQWREAIDRTRDFLDATGSVFTAGEVVHAYADVLFAKHDRPYSRDAYGSRKGQLTYYTLNDVTYYTLSDAIRYVEDALYPDAFDYDVKGIAREIVDWDSRRLVLTVDDDEFWNVVERYEY